MFAAEFDDAEVAAKSVATMLVHIVHPHRLVGTAVVPKIGDHSVVV